ncbi:MAG: PEP-CTERM sorting domain-containing protein [Sedimentisphaerales bacterium]|nr:PEP-CTERM sorting domain-containing protein [Sedimentisphaerales bacterium]
MKKEITLCLVLLFSTKTLATITCDAGGPYWIEPNGTVTFIGTHSETTLPPNIYWVERWFIDDVNTGTYHTYDELVVDLGLSLGIHKVTYVADAWSDWPLDPYEIIWEYGEPDSTFLGIKPIPEPASLLLLGLGGIALRYRRKK